MLPPNRGSPVTRGYLWVPGGPQGPCSSCPHSPPQAGARQVGAVHLGGQQEWALLGSNPDATGWSCPQPRAAGHQSVQLLLLLHGVGAFSARSRLSPGEKWDISGAPSLLLPLLLLQARGTGEPLPKVLGRSLEGVPVPGRQRGLHGQQLQGLFGPCCATGCSDCPTPLPAQGWTEDHQPHPERPTWGVEPPQEEAGLAALQVSGDSPACPHPALPTQRPYGDLAAPAQLQLQVNRFSPCLFWLQLVDGSSLVWAPVCLQVQFVDSSSSWMGPVHFSSSSVLPSAHS